MKDKKEFGEFIKRLRLQKGLSQKELADIVYVTESAVSKWERGISYPDISMISVLSKTLGVTDSELISASFDTERRKIKEESNRYRKITNLYFWIPTVCYVTALLICFVCNLAVEHRLSWFFIVLTSLLCAFSFVPTASRFVKRGKTALFLGSTLGSIALLLLTCALYTKNITWLGSALMGTTCGYIVFLLPILLKPLGRYLWLVSFTLDLGSVLLLLSVVCSAYPFALSSAVLTTLYGFAPFLLTGLILTLPMPKWDKASAISLIFGLFCYGVNFVLGIVWKDVFFYESRVDFGDWGNCSNGNTTLILLFVGVGLALLCFTVSRLKKRP